MTNEPKLTEVSITVRLPIEAAELIARLCYEEVNGVKILTKTDAQVARDALVKGLRLIMKERGLI